MQYCPPGSKKEDRGETERQTETELQRERRQMVRRTRTEKFRGKERERQRWFDSHFHVPAGLHCLSVSVCSVCSSQSFMWLPGTENLSVSCQRFQRRSVPLSALKNPLFHTHELHYLWPWLKWAVSGHAACVCLCFCVCV